ncbi:MAG: hypothetical protein ACP5OP_02065 [Leptospirillia bacterium]
MSTSGRRPGGALLIVADGLAESSHGVTTLSRSRTPALDRLARHGDLYRLDPQGGVREEEVTSERGVGALLGLGEGPTLSRGGLLSLLADFSPVRERAVPLSWFYVATPVRYRRGGTRDEDLLCSYVNDLEWESALWTTLLQRLPSVRDFELLPVFEQGLPAKGASGRRILRMVAGFSAVASEAWAPGLAPRTGRRRSEALALTGLIEWFDREVDLIKKAQALSPPEGEEWGLWLWGGGPPPKYSVPTSFDRALVGQAPLIRALGRVAGYVDLPLSRATGETDTDLREKLSQVTAALASGARRVVLHVEGFDMASHRKDPEAKRIFLERFDREVLEPLVESLLSGDLAVLGITSDHRSSPRTGNHEAGAVPALRVSGDSLGTPGRAGARMTEEAAELAPLISLDQWNDRLFSEGAPLGDLPKTTLDERMTCRELS